MAPFCDLSTTLLAPTIPSSTSFVVEENKSTFELKPRLDLWNSPQSSDYYYKAYFQQQNQEQHDDGGVEGQQQQQQQQQQRRKSVRFSRRLTKTEDYIHVEEFTLEEKEACWYPIWGVM